MLVERLSNRALHPFYVTLAIYFTIFQPCVVLPRPSFPAAIAKALPVWSLALYVRLTSGDRSSRYFPKSLYHQNIIFALLFSSLGDIFLIFDSDLFEDGILCFAIAQLFYFSVIRGAWAESRMKYLFMFAGLFSFSCLLNYIDDAIMDAFILLYLILLYTMGWRAASRLLKEDMTFEGLATFSGSLLFIVSDTVMTTNRLSATIPVVDFVAMIMYYLAHLCYCLTTGSVKIQLRLENVAAILFKTRKFWFFAVCCMSIKYIII